MPDWWESEDALDTLHLTTEEYYALVSELSPEREAGKNSDRRRHARLRFWFREVIVRLHRFDRADIPYRVKAHNISTRGIAFLHGFFVQTGTVCETALATASNRTVAVPGRVVRCRHVAGKAHEFGVEFDRNIDLHEFLPEEVLGSGVDGAGDELPHFSGKALYVDDVLYGRELMQFIGQELGLEMKAVGSAAEARACVGRARYDVVLIKTTLPEGGAGGLAETLRQCGFGGFLVAVGKPVAGALGESEEAQALARGCNCVLGGPVTAERMAELLATVLPTSAATAGDLKPLYSTQWHNTKMRPLILRFAAHLETRLRELHAAVNRTDTQLFATSCQELISLAESYGYGPIAAGLRELVMAIAADTPPTQIAAKLADVSRLCAAARGVCE